MASRLPRFRFILALARLCGLFVSALRNLENKASSTAELEDEYCAPGKRVTNFIVVRISDDVPINFFGKPPRRLTPGKRANDSRVL